LHIPTGTYLGLDRSAALIVNLLNENSDLLSASSQLSSQVGISPDQALRDVGAVINAVSGVEATKVGKGRRPSVVGVLMVTRSWWRQSWRYRIATLEVALVVLVIEVGLKVTDVSRLARWLGVPLATERSEPPVVGPDDLSELSNRERRIHWAVYWVMARWLYDGTCLRRGLAFGWFLRQRSPVLRLGMLADNSSIAHAWIEVNGKAFNAQPVSAPFAATSYEPALEASRGAGGTSVGIG
jgi:hypothetical protein